MKSLILLLTSLISLSAFAESTTAAGVDPNNSQYRSNGDRSVTAAGTTAQALDCPACRAYEARTHGATGAAKLSIYDALNPNLALSSRQAFVPGKTPLSPIKDKTQSGQDSGQAGTSN